MKHKSIKFAILTFIASTLFLVNLMFAQTTENNDKSLAQNTKTGKYCCIKNDNNNCTDVPDCVKKEKEEEGSLF